MAIDIASMTNPQKAAFAAAVGLAPGLLPFDVTISSAAILDGWDNPVEVIAAQGANKVIRFIELNILRQPGNVAYNTGDSGLMTYGTDINGKSVATSMNNIVLNNPNRMLSTYNPLLIPDGDPDMANFANVPVCFHFANNDFDGPPTLGNGTVRVFGLYRVIDLS